MAAQYGQTAFLYHVALRWDADVDAQDADGRTPLHWAAYKGFGDTIRLLLVMDARWGLADREGCTPLHWAAIRGNAEACTLLLQVRRKPPSTVACCCAKQPVLLSRSSHVVQTAFQACLHLFPSCTAFASDFTLCYHFGRLGRY